MRASAPGKLVLSGAYAVLRGAPAIVTAVDRRVKADTTRAAAFEAPEVVAGLRLLNSSEPLPWYDAGPLRDEGAKLGLGSSAAICVACLGAVLAKATSEPRPLEDLRADLYPIARHAHREAQGGGSGVDVAAACFGGTLVAQLNMDSPEDAPDVQEAHLPASLVIEVWASGQSASTSAMVKEVFEHEASHPQQFAPLLKAQTNASHRAAKAATAGDAAALIAALQEQFVALDALGTFTGAPIVLPEMRDLAALLPQRACLLPSGAGGGDVNLYFGQEPSPAAFRQRAAQLGHTPVPLSLGAPGLTLSA